MAVLRLLKSQSSNICQSRKQESFQKVDYVSSAQWHQGVFRDFIMLIFSGTAFQISHFIKYYEEKNIPALIITGSMGYTRWFSESLQGITKALKIGWKILKDGGSWLKQ